MSSVFEAVELAPPNVIFNLGARCRADPAPNKADLGIGAYRGNDGKPWKLPVVAKAERLVLEDAARNYQYLPILGMKEFRELAVELILGVDSPALSAGRAGGVQSLSGTGALRLGGEFLHTFHPSNEIYLPNPTWGNHQGVFAAAGLAVKQYRYFHRETLGLDFEGLKADLEGAPDGSIVLLHACAHNPTGVDPTTEQWVEIAALLKRKRHFPFFDCAYQGFASGDLSKDAAAVRAFVAEGLELFVAQSFAKNFGLYNQRVGCLTVVCASGDAKDRVLSQLEGLARAMYSNPPENGAKIVATTLTDAALTAEWHGNLRVMSQRITDMRKLLHGELVKVGAPGNWDHIVNQIGMFSFTGLTPEQVDEMVNTHSVYMLRNGRISMAGVNTGNAAHIAASIKNVLTK